MADYETTLKDKKNELIRKGLEGSVFVGQITVPAITAAGLFDAVSGEIKALPVGMDDLGWTTADGAQFARAITSSDIASWGSGEPTRSDVTADTTTLQVTAQETKLLTLGIYTGANLESYAAAANGTIEVQKPSRPPSRYYRVASIAVDLADEGEFYLVRYLPRAKPTDYADQAHANGDSAIEWGFTFTGFEDATLGFAEDYILGGPGCKALAVEMGATLGP